METRSIPADQSIPKFNLRNDLQVFKKVILRKGPKQTKQILATSKINAQIITQKKFNELRPKRNYTRRFKIKRSPVNYKMAVEAMNIENRSRPDVTLIGKGKFGGTNINYGAGFDILEGVPEIRKTAIQNLKQQSIVEQITKKQRSSKPILYSEPVRSNARFTPSNLQLVEFESLSKFATAEEAITSRGNRSSNPIIRANTREGLLPKIGLQSSPRITSSGRLDLFQVARSDQSSKSIIESKPIVDVKPFTGVDSIIASPPKLKTKQKIDFKRSNKPDNPSIRRIKFGYGKISSRNKIKTFKVPKSKKTYSPSVFAGIKNIYGKQPSIITQLGVNPILRKQRRKRK